MVEEDERITALREAITAVVEAEVSLAVSYETAGATTWEREQARVEAAHQRLDTLLVGLGA